MQKYEEKGEKHAGTMRRMEEEVLTFLLSTASAMIFIQPLKVATWKRER